MAGVPSCSRVLATQRDDGDTIQDTLGRTLKARNKRGHERGHGHGRECSLRSGCELCKDLPVYFSFYGDWLKQGTPIKGRCAATPRISQSRTSTPLNMCVWRPFASPAHDFTDLFTRWETWPILSERFQRKRVICVFCHKHERVLVVFVSSKVRVMWG